VQSLVERGQRVKELDEAIAKLQKTLTISAAFSTNEPKAA
jgi:hypothetical protein